MQGRRLRFEVVQGETEHISLSGHKRRNQTVLIRFGGLSLSKKAAILGLALVACQVFDGLLTYIGLTLLGTHMEGNVFLRALVNQWGTFPALFAVKLGAAVLAVALMLQAHRRRWVRPVIFFVVLVYLGLALIPWVITLADSANIGYRL